MRNFDFILKVVKTMQELGEQVRRLDSCGEDARSYSVDSGPRGEERQQWRPLGGHHDGPAVKRQRQRRQSKNRAGELGTREEGNHSEVFCQFGGAAPTAQDKVLKQ